MTRSIAVTSERLGRIVEEAASEVYVFGVEDFYFRLVNKGARENLGYNADELSRLTPWDLKPRIRRDDFLALIRPLLAGEVDRLDFDTVHRRKDGSEYDVSVKLQLFDDGDDPVFYAAIQDTTQYRRVEQQLRDTAQRLDVILDNTTMAVFLMDDRQHCVFMNRAAEKLTGYAFEETTGRPLHDVIHHTRPDGSHFPLSECAIDRAFPDRAGVQGEEVFVHKDGGFYPVAFTASPIHGEGAQVIGTVIEARDISEEKRNAEVRNLLMHEVDHRAQSSGHRPVPGAPDPRRRSGRLQVGPGGPDRRPGPRPDLPGQPALGGRAAGGRRLGRTGRPVSERGGGGRGSAGRSVPRTGAAPQHAAA
jgi:PAS domain S-box-containing protein